MRSKIHFIPLLGIYLLLMSATIVKKDTAYTGSTLVMPSVPSTHVKAHKLNFFQRLALKYYYLKKNKFKNDINADKLASTSLVLGISACGAILLGLFIPYLILAAVPLAIAAMATGGSAERNHTQLIGKARTGKALGLGALIAFGLILVLAVIVLAAFVSSL